MEKLPLPQATPAQRPTAVTVLGWVFVVFSGFSIMSSAFALAIMQFMSRVVPDGEFPPQAKDFPPEFSMLSWIFEYFNEFLVVQTLLAIFSVFAAIQFLKLRAWSRTYFEVLNWIGLTWIVLFGVFFAFSWVGIISGMTAPETAEGIPPAGLVSAFGVLFSIFVIIFNGAFPAGIIWLLRSRFIHPAFVRTI